jgi:hypothetical protein
LNFFFILKYKKEKKILCLPHALYVWGGMLYGGAELDWSGWYLALFISLGLMVLLVRFLLWACWDWFLLGCPITWDRIGF